MDSQMLLGGSGEVDLYGWKVVVWSVGVEVVWARSRFLVFLVDEVPRMMVVKKRWW